MDEKTKKILESNEVDKIAFYTVDSPLVNNLFTTCVFINTRLGRIEARGVAICSLLDSYSKKKGRQKAFGRAVAALLHQRNLMKIKSGARLDEFISRKTKLKNDVEQIEFANILSDELAYAGVHDASAKFIRNPGDKYTKCCYSLPLSYPIKAANDHFKYKSQFLPKPANEEEIRLLKEHVVFTEAIKDEGIDFDF